MDDPAAAADETVDAAGAVAGLVAAAVDEIADAAGRAGEGTRSFTGFYNHGYKEATARVVAFCFLSSGRARLELCR